jgi:hypothetical protein
MTARRLRNTLQLTHRNQSRTAPRRAWRTRGIIPLAQTFRQRQGRRFKRKIRGSGHNCICPLSGVKYYQRVDRETVRAVILKLKPTGTDGRKR